MGQITVEVAYGNRDRQELIEISVPRGTTLIEAVEASGVMRLFPEIDLQNVKLGVFGRIESKDKVLEAHDRVEIYRPLRLNPKEARRRRAIGS
ncbi:MAG: RnfH family protein [Pseudomonadales bacterium]